MVVLWGCFSRTTTKRKIERKGKREKREEVLVLASIRRCAEVFSVPKTNIVN